MIITLKSYFHLIKQREGVGILFWISFSFSSFRVRNLVPDTENNCTSRRKKKCVYLIEAKRSERERKKKRKRERESRVYWYGGVQPTCSIQRHVYNNEKKKKKDAEYPR